MKASPCRGCRALIRWVETPTGEPIALDWAPDPEGLYTILDGLAVYAEGPAAERYTSHFATCSLAKYFGPHAREAADRAIRRVRAGL